MSNRLSQMFATLKRKNTKWYFHIINYRKYYDNKTLRCTIGIFYLLFKIYQKNNNFKIIFSLLVGKDKSIFYKSLYQGMKNQLGKFKE